MSGQSGKGTRAFLLGQSGPARQHDRDKHTAENDALAFCEPVSATVRSREHIRIVGPEGFKYGGGIPNDALCGANVRRGWDQCVPVHPSRFAPNAETNPTCQACIDAYYARVIPPGKTEEDA